MQHRIRKYRAALGFVTVIAGGYMALLVATERAHGVQQAANLRLTREALAAIRGNQIPVAFERLLVLEQELQAR